MATSPSNILVTDSWTVMGKLAINILVQGIFGIYVLIFIGKIPTKEIAGSQGYVYLLLKKLSIKIYQEKREGKNSSRL